MGHQDQVEAGGHSNSATDHQVEVQNKFDRAPSEDLLHGKDESSGSGGGNHSDG